MHQMTKAGRCSDANKTNKQRTFRVTQQWRAERRTAGVTPIDAANISGAFILLVVMCVGGVVVVCAERLHYRTRIR